MIEHSLSAELVAAEKCLGRRAFRTFVPD